MALNKKCCIKCRNTYSKSSDECNVTSMKWDGVDEEVWKAHGMVWCPSIYRKEEEYYYRKITGKPPVKCPYYLENIL